MMLAWTNSYLKHMHAPLPTHPSQKSFSSLEINTLINKQQQFFYGITPVSLDVKNAGLHFFLEALGFFSFFLFFFFKVFLGGEEGHRPPNS